MPGFWKKLLTRFSLFFLALSHYTFFMRSTHSSCPFLLPQCLWWLVGSSKSPLWPQRCSPPLGFTCTPDSWISMTSASSASDELQPRWVSICGLWIWCTPSSFNSWCRPKCCRLFRNKPDIFECCCLWVCMSLLASFHKHAVPSCIVDFTRFRLVSIHHTDTVFALLFSLVSVTCHCSVCLQTAVISYDYLTAFKHVEYGTEEYLALRSKVGGYLGWYSDMYYDPNSIWC